jgi:hypothetical protein
MVLLKCPNCGVLFIRRKNETYLQKPKSNFTACSKECSNSIKSILWHGSEDDKELMMEKISKNIILEFTDHTMSNYKDQRFYI